MHFKTFCWTICSRVIGILLESISFSLSSLKFYTRERLEEMMNKMVNNILRCSLLLLFGQWVAASTLFLLLPKQCDFFIVEFGGWCYFRYSHCDLKCSSTSIGEGFFYFLNSLVDITIHPILLSCLCMSGFKVFLSCLGLYSAR